MFFFLFTFFFAQSAWAFKLSLLESTIDLAEGRYSSTATIINNGESTIAIEAMTRLRSHSRDGTENFEQEAENLLIIPTQMIIPPGSEQVLNIRYVGPRDLSSEIAYRLVIEYVSISEDKLKGLAPESKKAGVNIVYRIAKSFYVVPKNSNPNVTLDTIKKTTVNNKDMLHMSFKNIGNKHQVFSTVDVQFTTKTAEKIDVSFNQKFLQDPINLLAADERDIIIPLPEPLQNHEIVSAKIIGLVE